MTGRKRNKGCGVIREVKIVESIVSLMTSSCNIINDNIVTKF